MSTVEIFLKMYTDYLVLFVVYHVNCYYYQTFAKNLCILIHRVLVSNPLFSISSLGFQKSSPSFLKDESGFFRIRDFLESGFSSSPSPGPSWVSKYAEAMSALKVSKYQSNKTYTYSHYFLPPKILHIIKQSKN